MQYQIGCLEKIIPKKPYATLSRSQCEKRLDVMYRKLLSAVIRRGSAHLRANLDRYRFQTEFDQALVLIKKWKEDHKDTGHLSSRQHENIYPWGRRVTAENYRREKENKKIRLDENVLRTRRALDEAVHRFSQQIDFVRSGYAWLAKQSESVGASVLADQDPTPPGHIKDCVTGNPEDVIFRDAALAQEHRKQAGWKTSDFKLHNALAGDGLTCQKSLSLVAKLALPGHLRAAVAHHLFWAGCQQTSDFKPLAFDLENFANHRKEATLRLLGEPKERRHEITGPADHQEFRYRPHIFTGVERETKPRAKFRGSQSEKRPPLMFSPQAKNSLERELSGKDCDPELRKVVSPMFDDIQSAARSGHSFVLTGGAGTGKTSMVPALTSFFLANAHSVKVLGASGSLDRIEALCHKFMSAPQNVTVPMVWIREPDYLLFFTGRNAETLGAAKSSKERDAFIESHRNVRHEMQQSDVLLIDDATLVPFHSAFVTRYKQVIVIGDQQQISVDKSVFENATKSGLAVFRLSVTTRSRNCDAMTWSNIFAYDNTLISSYQGKPACEVHYLPLARSARGVVQSEAAAIATAVRASLKSSGSTGLVAFSDQQLEAILCLIPVEEQKSLAFRGLPADLMGREADNVYVSFGVAFNLKNRLPAFLDGFEDDQSVQRMNVALSRARRKNVIFSSILPGDIDLRTATDAQTLLLSLLETSICLNRQALLDPGCSHRGQEETELFV